MFRDKNLITLTVINAVLLLVYLVFAYLPVTAVTASIAGKLSGMHAAAPDVLTVVQGLPFGAMDPHAADPADQPSLGLVFEPLIRTDSFVGLTPALAESWYWQDDHELVVQLDRAARFHDGTPLDCAAVSHSLTRAQTATTSGLRSALAGVSVAPMAGHADACVFSLARPDHQFIAKLTRLFIISPASGDGVFFGSGRYELIDVEDAARIFAAFPEYRTPSRHAPAALTLIAAPQKYQRLALLRSGSVDILLDVPSSFVTQIESRLGYAVSAVPTADTTFALFNVANPHLADQALRARIAAMVAHADVATLLNDHSLRAASQFAPSGVFGFAPDLQEPLPPSVPEALPTAITLSLAVTETNRLIAEVLQRVLAPYRVDLDIRMLSDEAMLRALRAGQHDIFITGWRYTLGTVDDFFADVIHSRKTPFGTLNGYGYRNRDVDAIIEHALTEADDTHRLALFQDLMRRVVRDDVIGMPLLDIRQLYAVRDGVTFQPRMDGLILFDSR